MARKTGGKYKENIAAIQNGLNEAGIHPLVRPLPGFDIGWDGPALEQGPMEWLRMECAAPRADYLYPSSIPEVPVKAWLNVRRRAPPSHWAYVVARARLHIAMNHLDPGQDSLAWHMACWFFADELAQIAGVGRRPADFPPLPTGLPRGDEHILAAHLERDGVPEDLQVLSLSFPGERFWRFSERFELSPALKDQRRAGLASGIRAAATEAVDVAGGARRSLGVERDADTTGRRARDWVISEYPLLAALASSFALIEDPQLCDAMSVPVAAISDQTREIYVNSRVKLSEGEARFVMAHELLHAGLRHSHRRQGRDAWLWNIACDFVINGWLIEMQVGDPPDTIGYLYDPSLATLSAEEVYDRIVTDLRWMRRLRKAHTMNGRLVDILEGEHPPGWWRAGGTDLDAFYRRTLTEGLELHQQKGRGLLPAGLVEEIRALSQPPIPWDVDLAHWLDQFFPPLERRRTFARAHRRQSASPDIPRPAWVSPDESRSARVFGAVVDTSGSMSRADLGKAVGAIASYAMSRDVGYVRLIQCDAAAHDCGYVEPEALLERIEVRGRGGTVLMPGIRMIEEARDFPPDGPLLVITDGGCDRLTIRRDHAFLLVEGGRLPFQAKGPVFRFA